MTDSSCTTIESNYHSSRGPQRISQSTVDEVLPEESSTETSPQQRHSEEKSSAEEDTASGDDEKPKTELIKKSMLFSNCVNVLEGKTDLCFDILGICACVDDDIACIVVVLEPFLPYFSFCGIIFCPSSFHCDRFG